VPVKLLVISNYIHTVTVRPEAEIILQLQKTSQYEITVMTSAKAEYAQKFVEAGIRVIDFLPTKKFSLNYVKLIRKELLEGKYHIVQAFNNKAMVNTLIAAMGLPVKVVVYRGYTGNISWLDPLMYIKYLSPRVDRIVCLVEAIRQIFRKNLLFHKDKAVTINKGHDVHWYDDVKALDKRSLGIPDDAFTFVCGANSRRMKGIKYLLQATYFLPANTRIHLMLA
jgi:L-malate glycosyltransferase